MLTIPRMMALFALPRLAGRRRPGVPRDLTDAQRRDMGLPPVPQDTPDQIRLRTYLTSLR